MEEINLIGLLVDGIVAEVHPLQVVLFGSRSRGDGRSDSDIDLMIVVPEGTHRRETARRLYRKLLGTKVSFDLIVATESDLERHKDNIGLIYRTILQEGKVLYAA